MTEERGNPSVSEGHPVGLDIRKRGRCTIKRSRALNHAGISCAPLTTYYPYPPKPPNPVLFIPAEYIFPVLKTTVWSVYTMGIGSLLERIGTIMAYEEAIEILFDKWETVCDHLDILREDLNKLDRKYRSSVDTYNETRESMKNRITVMKERAEDLRQAMNSLGAGE